MWRAHVVVSAVGKNKQNASCFPTPFVAAPLSGALEKPTKEGTSKIFPRVVPAAQALAADFRKLQNTIPKYQQIIKIRNTAEIYCKILRIFQKIPKFGAKNFCMF